MSNDFQQLIEDSKILVDALKRKGAYGGFKRLLSELYPDNAHFIYELLQNAEDAGATEAKFTLNEDRVEFIHNGSRLFSFADVKSLTNIGESTKRDDHTNIGKFGVGFKAVFAYTETPEIESGEFHFRIRDMVVPDITDLPPRATSGKNTRFVFPFDNSKKSPENAYKEIERNFQQLGENTLLFLNSIRKIEYDLPNSTFGFLERVDLGEKRIEITSKHTNDAMPLSSVYLRFDKIIQVSNEDGESKSCRIATAFKLENLQEKEKENQKSVSRWKIQPVDGRVSIYFPADKETSNLHFHLHAPFASTVARDSVRDCSANNELRDHLANLIAESMSTIRDQGLLTVGFLGTLPNDKDNLSAFYKPIQDKLINVFRTQNLVPMKQGGHAPGHKSFRGGALLSNLINDEDLAQILGKNNIPPLWIANPSQRNQREDNFLSMLNISEWSFNDLFNRLVAQPESMKEWMSTKSNEWHQQFYALLGVFLSEAPQYYDPLQRMEKLKKLSIVRISDGTYDVGSKSYFPSDEIESDNEMPRVAKSVYTSGKSENEQKRAKEFLEDIGVREVGEAEQIEAILNHRYLSETNEFDIQDIKRFVALVEKDSKKAGMFKDCLIFKTVNGQWKKPSDIYLDSPYLQTGLSAYYSLIADKATRYPLSRIYGSCGVELEKLAKFAEAVGAATTLPISKCSCSGNPEWDYLRRVGGERYTYHIDNDWVIYELDNLLKSPNAKISLLVWNTLRNIKSQYITAHYQKNERHGFRSAKSQLIHQIKNAAWIPQNEQGTSLYKFVSPANADAQLLPAGFTFDKGWEWVKCVDFGSSIHQREETDRLDAQRKTTEYQREEESAKSLGFESAESAMEAKELLERKRKDPEGFRKWQEQSNRGKPSFPTRHVPNKERREERERENTQNSFEKEYEPRETSVRVTRGSIDPKSWLKNQYTNESGQMICQICADEMPFKKRNGEYYFEHKEALSTVYFPNENEAQHLALCPVCAAKYEEFIKSDEAAMKDLSIALINSETLEIPIKLGEWGKIKFVESHWIDIKIILKENE